MTEDKVREYLQLIMESGYKLKEIINSLLLLAGVNRMETVEIRPLDMGDVVYSAQARLTAMIDEHSAEIIMPPRWPKALGYAPWVEEIWANYLSNALKYGGTPPRIEFGAEPCDDGQVRFWIRDNGQGLSPEDQQRVFTPFTRLSQAKIEGHGLGLSVVQRIVERLDGAVGVESQVGAGSTFSFTLPRAP
jgi:signal transduction histidine kinase